jgi:hypothetical protein
MTSTVHLRPSPTSDSEEEEGQEEEEEDVEAGEEDNVVDIDDLAMLGYADF